MAERSNGGDPYVGANHGEMDDVFDLVRSWMRWAWLAVVFAAVGWLVASQADALLGDGGEAEARAVVGLTEAAEWPLFESILTRTAGLATDDETRAAALTEAGIDPSEISVATELDGGRLITITTRGPADLVKPAAEAIAVASVAQVDQAVLDSIQEERGELAGLIGPLEEQITGWEAEIADLNTRIDAIEGEERQTLRIEVDVLESNIEAALVTVRARSVEVANLDAELETHEPALELAQNVGTVGLGDGGALRSAPILGALLGVLGALAMAPALERWFGKVRSVHHSELASLSAPWIAVGEGNGPLAVADVATAVTNASRHVEGTIAVMSLQSAGRASEVTEQLRPAFGERVVDAGSVADSGAAAAAGAADAVVLLVDKKKSSRRATRAALKRLRDLQVSHRIPVLLGS